MRALSTTCIRTVHHIQDNIYVFTLYTIVYIECRTLNCSRLGRFMFHDKKCANSMYNVEEVSCLTCALSSSVGGGLGGRCSPPSIKTVSKRVSPSRKSSSGTWKDASSRYSGGECCSSTSGSPFFFFFLSSFPPLSYKYNKTTNLFLKQT